MRVKVLLQITAEDGTAGDAAEVAVFEKQTERPEDLGLSIAEGKALMAAVQQRVVDAQAASWAERHRCCEACGAAPAQQGQLSRHLHDAVWRCSNSPALGYIVAHARAPTVRRPCRRCAL